VTVYETDPVKVALRWQKEGAEIIHIVDLDGAFGGLVKNLRTVEKIAQSVDVPIQFGGGVRQIDTMKELFNAGVSQIVVGTAVVDDTSLVKAALDLFGGRIVIGIDARDGKVAVEGWNKVTKKDVVSLALEMEVMGASLIVYTDISKDGMLVGPNIEGTRKLAEAVDVPVIASGGVSALKDLIEIKKLEPYGVEGVIIGKALYENAFTLKQALEAVADAG
jgi:phosphoribosylformimino-5-aminoimidazole carboxamide ribotide isomerase